MTGLTWHRVLGPLRHDGHGYRPGERVALTPAQARPLVTAGAIAPADPDRVLVPDPLGQAISSLDPHDPRLWTRDGKPRLEPLSRLMRRPVSAAERDAAFTNPR
ncbi:MAG: hypothetical protein HQL97_11590 [Magnetococcales bacterium]|nr:hypothetical protein [Magnetococcales bacterium]MBF0262460.1 hypothetical protein [Magnetococcales bacterium]